MQEFEVDSLAQFIDQISGFARPHQRHLHLRLWFRGVPKASYKLVPSIFRSSTRPYPLEDDERHAFRDFRLWSAGLIPPGTSLEDIYFQQQHHNLPTRLLDWTTNALIALFFSVDSYPNEPCAVYAMDAYGLGEHDYRGLDGITRKAGGFAVTNNDPNSLLSVALAGIVQWRKDIDPPVFIFPIRPAFTDIRMQIQRSCFTYHPPTVQELTETQNNSLSKLVIPVSAKAGIKDQLFHLGIDHFSVFGDLDGLAKTVRGNFNVG